MNELKKLSKKRFWWTLARAALLFAFLGGVGLWVHLSDFNVGALLKEVPEEKSVSVGILIFLLFTFVTVAPISVRDLLRIYAALRLGLYWSTFWIWMSETAGAAIAFVLARYLGRDFVEVLAGRKIKDLNRYLERAGFKTILLLRLIPLTPCRPLNFAAGLTRVGFMDYLWASFIGMLPHVFLYQLVYSSLGEFFKRQIEEDARKGVGVLLAVNVIAAVITGIVIVLIGLWARKKSKSNQLSSER